MPFKIVRTPTVIERMDEVEKTASKKLRKINKTLGLLANDPHHPGLHTHKRGEETQQDRQFGNLMLRTIPLPRGEFSGITDRMRRRLRCSQLLLTPEA